MQRTSDIKIIAK